MTPRPTVEISWWKGSSHHVGRAFNVFEEHELLNGIRREGGTISKVTRPRLIG